MQEHFSFALNQFIFDRFILVTSVLLVGVCLRVRNSAVVTGATQPAVIYANHTNPSKI
jgi:hypothetical protein